METYTFNTHLAVRYGVGEAIILNAIATITTETTTYQGRQWAKLSNKDLSEALPFYTPRQVRTLIASLMKQGAIYSAYLCGDKRDRSLWYSINIDL